MGKELTLDELVKSGAGKSTQSSVDEASTTPAERMQQNALKSARPISTSELGKDLITRNPEANKEPVITEAPLVENAFNSMASRLQESKDYIDNVVMPIVEENAREMAMERELGTAPKDEEDGIPLEDENEEPIEVAPTVVPDNLNDLSDLDVEEEPEEKEEESGSLDDLLNDLGINDDEEDEEDEVIDDEDETPEELRERFKESLKNVKITKSDINLSEYSIRKEPVSSAAVLKDINSSKTTKKSDWPLYYSNRNMRFEECGGPELDSLRKTINNSNGVNGVIASLRFVYNHIVDANKKPFEAWAKSIRTEDIESLYFGMYKACYADANLVARADVKDKGCKKTSLIDTNIMDMVKYKDSDVKNKFDNLMQMDTTDPGTKIKSNMMVISDDLAISYSDPTLYSTFIQYAALKPEITEKYSDYLNTMAYIDGFFRIDQVTKQFIPISVKEYPNNLNKTVLTKLKIYIDLLKTLTNDQYNIMKGKLENLIDVSDITYIYPKTVCPECGNEIPEEDIDSILNLLFTRAQLVQVRNS